MPNSDTRPLRKNSVLARALGSSGTSFLCHGLAAIERLMPHTATKPWKEAGQHTESRAWWMSQDRQEIGLVLGFRGSVPACATKADSRRRKKGRKSNRSAHSPLQPAANTATQPPRPIERTISSSLARKSIDRAAAKQWSTMDAREHMICKLVIERLTSVLQIRPTPQSSESLAAIRRQFEDDIVSAYIKEWHDVHIDVASVLSAMHTLAEQTYENKPLSFGCIIDPQLHRKPDSKEDPFPDNILESKKYRALSDGYRTAFHISSHGAVVEFVALEHFGPAKKKDLSDSHYYPHWSQHMASCSRDKRCGIALTNHGDILVFDEGSLVLTYRFGRWQLWNHAALCLLLRDMIRGKKVALQTAAKLAKTIYKAALDASFRRRGALFVVLDKKNHLSEVTNPEDRVRDARREVGDRHFDGALNARVLQALPRETIAELASLDGAIVTERNGTILAYGAVLRPKKQGRLKGSEGSRTKAAIGASNYGVAVKVSSDGQITVYDDGQEFLALGRA